MHGAHSDDTMSNRGMVVCCLEELALPKWRVEDAAYIFDCKVEEEVKAFSFLLGGELTTEHVSWRNG